MLDNRRRYPTVQEGFEVWKNHLVSMGYGYPLGIDLPGEKRGYIPNSKVYDKLHRRWNSSTIISIAIGQGEISATPLQICNLAATIANRGYFITPHVVKEVQVHINANCHFRILIRSKTDKRRVIFSVRIFCRSCLTANLDSGNSSRPTGSAQYGVAHN